MSFVRRVITHEAMSKYDFDYPGRVRFEIG